jgi:hypothetical protein
MQLFSDKSGKEKIPYVYVDQRSMNESFSFSEIFENKKQRKQRDGIVKGTGLELTH